MGIVNRVGRYGSRFHVQTESSFLHFLPVPTLPGASKFCAPDETILVLIESLPVSPTRRSLGRTDGGLADAASSVKGQGDWRDVGGCNADCAAGNRGRGTSRPVPGPVLRPRPLAMNPLQDFAKSALPVHYLGMLSSL